MLELTKLSAAELIKKIKHKSVSCEEVMRAHLDQIAAINPRLNAIIQQTPPDTAIAQARQADEAIAKNKPLGKLHGLPITIKDCCNVKGFIAAKGSAGYRNNLATTDATVVARLRAEGAIILGITNVPEFMVAFETDNDLYGRTNNPYDLTRTPGGSSGGEAAIIAACGSPLGIGSDAGGSLRQPAHNTGIASIKPTKGLVPKTGSIPIDANGLIGQLGSMGPMARYVDDLILTLQIIAGPDGCDPYAYPVPLKNPAKVNLKELKVAFYTDNSIAKVTPDTINTIKNVIQNLESEVASIEEKRPPDLERSYQLAKEVFFLSGDKGKGLMALLNSLNLEKPSPILQEFIALANNCEYSVTDLRNYLFEVDLVRINLEKFMHHYDVIICPVAATPAKIHGKSREELQDFSYTTAYNFTGWPAAVVRCGTSSEGLPIGVQIVAKPWRDDVALAVAKRLEEIFGGWKEPQLLL